MRQAGSSLTQSLTVKFSSLGQITRRSWHEAHKADGKGRGCPWQGEAWQGRETEKRYSPARSSIRISSRRGPMGQIAPTLGTSGFKCRHSGSASPCCQVSRGVVVLNNPPGLLPQALYTHGSAPVSSEHPLLRCPRAPARPGPSSLREERARAGSVCPASPLGGRGCWKGIRLLGSGTAQDPGTKPGFFLKLFAYRPWLTSEKLRQSEAFNRAFCGLGLLLWHSLGKDFLLL